MQRKQKVRMEDQSAEEAGDEETEVATSKEGPEADAPEESSQLSDGSSKGWTPTDFYSSLPYQSDGIWEEEETALINDIPDEVEYHPVGGVNEEQETQRQAERQARAGRQDPADRWRSSSVSRDLWKISGDRAFVTIYHHRARKTLFVPSGIGFTIPADEFRNERYTACVQVGTGRMVAFSGERGGRPRDRVLDLQGNELPWEVYSPGGDDDEDEEPDRESGEEEEATPSTMYQSSPAQACSGEDSRSRSRSRRSGGRDRGAREAEVYVDLLRGLGEATAEEWAKVLATGNVEEAARLLWTVRRERGLDNLRGVEESLRSKAFCTQIFWTI